MGHPLHAHLLLARPERVVAAVARAAAAGGPAPNPFQVELGVLRMWHRALFRSETIGMARGGVVRNTLRARVWHSRPLRFPALLAAKAVAPWDMTGLASSRARLLCHLLGAHHDGHQMMYDLEILKDWPGALDELREAASSVVAGHHPDATFLRDLAVYEGYHERLLQHVMAFQRGELEWSAEEAADPDISFLAWLAWCAAQPPTPGEWVQAIRAGAFRFPEGWNRNPAAPRQ